MLLLADIEARRVIVFAELPAGDLIITGAWIYITLEGHREPHGTVQEHGVASALVPREPKLRALFLFILLTCFVLLAVPFLTYQCFCLFFPPTGFPWTCLQMSQSFEHVFKIKLLKKVSHISPMKHF